MKITLNDGSVQSGIYEVKNTILGYKKKPRIISATTKERYRLEEIQSIMMYTDTDSIPYEVIPVKKYMDSGRTEIKLAQVGYKGDQIELFYVSEIIYQGGPTGHFITTGAYCENYVKKTGDSLAYNMGYIYGAGQRGIKKRVREFFIDCPRLIEKVDKNEIPKKETLQITLFYENNCKTATSAN